MAGDQDKNNDNKTTKDDVPFLNTTGGKVALATGSAVAGGGATYLAGRVFGKSTAEDALKGALLNGSNDLAKGALGGGLSGIKL